MSKWRFSAVLALSLLLVGQAADAGVRKSGLTGAAFLKIGVGARPVALGSNETAWAQNRRGVTKVTGAGS